MVTNSPQGTVGGSASCEWFPSFGKSNPSDTARVRQSRGVEPEDPDEDVEYVASTYTAEQLSAAREAVVDALGNGPNPQSYKQLEGNGQLERGLVVMAAGRLAREERVTLEQGGEEILVWLVVAPTE